MPFLERGEEYVFSKVGMEPTGDPFNSIIKLETANSSRPLNPMINAGALAITSILIGDNDDEEIGTDSFNLCVILQSILQLIILLK